jgi:hypothetical protein
MARPATSPSCAPEGFPEGGAAVCHSRKKRSCLGSRQINTLCLVSAATTHVDLKLTAGEVWVFGDLGRRRGPTGGLLCARASRRRDRRQRPSGEHQRLKQTGRRELDLGPPRRRQQRRQDSSNCSSTGSSISSSTGGVAPLEVCSVKHRSKNCTKREPTEEAPLPRQEAPLRIEAAPVKQRRAGGGRTGTGAGGGRRSRSCSRSRSRSRGRTSGSGVRSAPSAFRTS